MSPRELGRRRKQLLRQMGKGGIALLPAAPMKTRNRDVEYGFRQDSDFYYLTGFPEPEAVVVLAPGRKQGEVILFCRDCDPEKEVWTGKRLGPEGAVREGVADEAFLITDLDQKMPELLEGRDRIYYALGKDQDFDQKVMGWLRRLRGRSRSERQAPQELVSLESVLHEMRLIKSRSEVGAMRRAVQIAVAAHRRAMKACRPGMREFELEAEILHEFRRHGTVPSYGTIVGGGANGCVLHYVANQGELRDGDMVLVDAGCEYNLYASDITRTFPVNGVFTAQQRALYNVVLAAQREAIGKVAPGNHWNDPHDAAVKVITRGLVRLGLLAGKPSALVKSGAYRKFFMHRTGHWLGMDVHDVGDYKRKEGWRRLEPGMVLTVEPGIYIPPGTKGVGKKWWGIGIRVEDDVLVTRGGQEVLTRALPKDPDGIEALMRS
ncbi:MAG: Xaa-Pro aminopeptidase [Acidobacteriota bacterium]